jgi:hypothetical protein
LRALTEHHSDPLRERPSIRMRHQTVDVQRAGRRNQDAGQHLDRRGLARAVLADVADDLPARDVERDAIHGRERPRLAMHEIEQCALHAFTAIEDGERLRQIRDVDQHAVRVVRFIHP